MDIPNYVQVLSEFMRDHQPMLDSTVKFGTSVYTIGSSVVKVLQKGKHLATVAIGKKKPKPRSKTATKEAESLPAKSIESIVPKRNVAIVVEIARPAVQDAVRFLKKKKIDANLVVITKTRSKAGSVPGLDETKPKVWFEVVQEFSAAIDAIKEEMGGVHTHIFLAMPVALSFGLGAVWGTVDEATIYHWNGKEYLNVLEIQRELRFKLRKGSPRNKS